MWWACCGAVWLINFCLDCSVNHVDMILLSIDICLIEYIKKLKSGNEYAYLGKKIKNKNKTKLVLELIALFDCIEFIEFKYNFV